MNENKPSRDLVDVFLLLTSMGAIAMGLSGSCILFSLQFFVAIAGTRADGFVDVFTPLSLIVLSLSAIPAALISIRAFRGRRSETQKLPSPTILSVILIFPIALFVGSQAITGSSTPGFLGSLAHIVTALIPVLVAVVIVHRHGPRVSQRRNYGCRSARTRCNAPRYFARSGTSGRRRSFAGHDRGIRRAHTGARSVSRTPVPGQSFRRRDRSCRTFDARQDLERET